MSRIRRMRIGSEQAGHRVSRTSGPASFSGRIAIPGRSFHPPPYPGPWNVGRNVLYCKETMRRTLPKDEKTPARSPSADALRRNLRLQRPTGPAIAAKHRSLRPHVRARPTVPSVGRGAAGRLEPIRAVRSRTGGSMRIDRGAGEGARTSVPAARSRNRLFGPRAGRGTACPHNASRHLRQASRGMAAQGRGYGNGRFLDGQIFNGDYISKRTNRPLEYRNDKRLVLFGQLFPAADYGDHEIKVRARIRKNAPSDDLRLSFKVATRPQWRDVVPFGPDADRWLVQTTDSGKPTSAACRSPPKIEERPSDGAYMPTEKAPSRSGRSRWKPKTGKNRLPRFTKAVATGIGPTLREDTTSGCTTCFRPACSFSKDTPRAANTGRNG